MTRRISVVTRVVILGLASLGLAFAVTLSTSASAQDQPGPTPAGIRIEDGNRRLPEHVRSRLNEIRDRVQRDGVRLVADPDDEDTWVAYLAAGLAIGLVAVGALMLRRGNSDG